MRRSAACCLFVLALIMTTSLTAQTLPAPKFITDPTQLQTTPVSDLQNFSIEKLYMTRGVGGLTWSPDAEQLAFITNISGRNNLWLIPANGGWPTQFTISEQRQSSPAWSPDGKQIVFQSDKDGNEMWDLFMVSVADGEVVNLTASDQTSEEDASWSPDGKRLAYMRRAKTSPSYEIDVMDVETRMTRHITKSTPAE